MAEFKDGFLLIIHPDNRIEVEEVASPIDNSRLGDRIRAIIGGYMEIIPDMQTLGLPDTFAWHLPENAKRFLSQGVVRCLGLCDEDGKLVGKPDNEVATSLWASHLVRQGLIQTGPDGRARMPEALSGTIVFAFGDDAFFEAIRS